MTTRIRQAPSRPAIPPGPGSLDRARRWLGPLVFAGAIGIAIAAFYLWIYRAKHLTVPMGWDTSRYLWRTTLARAVGIGDMAGAVPSYVNADPARPAFPVLSSTLSSLWGVGLFRMAAVLPPVAAAAIGLGAGSFVGSVLRRPVWEVAAVAAGVGTSAFLVRLMGPETYQDNLFAAAVFMAAAVPLAMCVLDRATVLPAAVLLGAGGVIHWAFFVFMLGAIVLMALAYGPRSWRAWHTGTTGPLGTPSVRLAGAGAGAAALAAATIYGVLGTTTRSPRVSEQEFARKLHVDLPTYRFSVTLPLAAMGVASLTGARNESRVRGVTGRPNGPVATERLERDRAAMALLLAWCGVAVAGYLAFVVFDLPIPAHRFLAFALAVPVLAVLGVLWLGGMLARWARPLGVALVLVLLALGAWTSHTDWVGTDPWIDPERTRQAATAGAYLDAAGVDTERPVVFIVNDVDASFVALMTHMIRSVLPAERIGEAYFYAGSPDDYLARRPTPALPGEQAGLSRKYFSNMVETYDRNPVALILDFYNGDRYREWVRVHPESVVGPQVAVVSGPHLTAPVPAVPGPVGPYSSITLGLVAVGSLATLWAAGMGWGIVLLRRWLRPVDLCCIAPAVGIAALVLGGVLVDRSGVRLTGLAGAATPVAVAAAGWAVAAVSVRRRVRSSVTPA